MRRITAKYEHEAVAFSEHPFLWLDGWIGEAEKDNHQAKAVSRFFLAFFIGIGLVLATVFVVVSLVIWQPLLTLGAVAFLLWRWVRWTVRS
jgi:Flp pilus assembly protein TadB